MYNLNDVEIMFHEYLKSEFRLEYNLNELKITEDLLNEEEALYIPFGWISYFLVIEHDEKPVLYVNAVSRMDLDLVAFIDENGYEEYDIWGGNHPEIIKKYNIHKKQVKKFNYDDLKFINDVKR